MGYFDTSQKVLGILVTHPSQVDEVASFANTFSPPVDVRMQEIPAYLRENNGRMLPMIDLAAHLFDKSTGALVHDYGMVLECLLHTVQENHQGRVLFWWNEIEWLIRISAFGGKPQAEAEVVTRYENLRHQAKLIGEEIRRRIAGSGVLHIESSAELSQQWNAWGHIAMFEDCEYLAFDCYGPIADCGGRPQNDYLIWVWNTVDVLERETPIGRKVFLVPAAFKDSLAFPDEATCVAQLDTYFAKLDEHERFGGVGAFTWGTVVEAHNTIIGARHLERVGPAVSWHLYRRNGPNAVPRERP
jgi:hypothetical protein